MSEYTIADVKAELARIASKAGSRVDEMSEKQGELQARLLDLEQRAARRGGGDEDHGGGEGPGSLVIKAEGLDELRSGELKSLRIPVKSFPVKAALTSTDWPGIADRDSDIYAPCRNAFFCKISSHPGRRLWVRSSTCRPRAPATQLCS